MDMQGNGGEKSPVNRAADLAFRQLDKQIGLVRRLIGDGVFLEWLERTCQAIRRDVDGDLQAAGMAKLPSDQDELDRLREWNLYIGAEMGRIRALKNADVAAAPAIAAIALKARWEDGRLITADEHQAASNVQGLPGISPQSAPPSGDGQSSKH
jgi:hypothetical protein